MQIALIFFPFVSFALKSIFFQFGYFLVIYLFFILCVSQTVLILDHCKKKIIAWRNLGLLVTAKSGFFSHTKIEPNWALFFLLYFHNKQICCRVEQFRQPSGELQRLLRQLGVPAPTLPHLWAGPKQRRSQKETKTENGA